MDQSLFDEAALQRAEQEYAKVALVDDQRMVLESVSAVLAQHVDMNEMAIRGFLLRITRDWQIRTKRTVAELATSTREDRVAFIRGSLDEFKRSATSLLKESQKQKAHSVELAVDRAFAHYMETLALRKG